MTKKETILKMFHETEWNKGHDDDLRRTKIITSDAFRAYGLYGDVENASQHCDVLYARRIIQGLGHRVIVGGALFVWEKE